MSQPTIEQILSISPVVPVVVLDSLEQAVPLAEALVSNGIGTIEVTLRSEVALAAIGEIARKVPEICVGAGTLIYPAQVKQVQDQGAQFAVSPGLLETLVDEATRLKLPLLPGIASASELMRGLNLGLNHFKLFPAEVVGGLATLKALQSPFAEAVFCPTGGISLTTAPEYLALANVAAVGGSWLAPKDLVSAEDWNTIGEIARQTLQTLAPC